MVKISKKFQKNFKKIKKFYKNIVKFQEFKGKIHKNL